MIDKLDPDSVSRIALIALKNGTAKSLEEAEQQITDRSITIDATTVDPTDPACQAALITAAALAVRSFGRVNVVSLDLDEKLWAGPYRGATVGVALRELGVEMSPGQAPDVTVVIGDAPVDGRVVYAGWRGWIGEASPNPSVAAARSGSNVVAAIASAALAISEAFHFVLNEPGSDAGYRTVTLDLWGGRGEQKPLTFAPAGWWLVGLGHLGQAHAWIISHLPYPAPQDVEVIVQDTDISSHANHSTSVMTPPHSAIPKTRLVAAALDRAHLRARIFERRMSDKTKPEDTEVGHVALIGVDNLPTRRTISSMGWARVIDVGLGDGPFNYGSISLHSFPSAQRSEGLAAWVDRGVANIELPDAPGFRDLSERFDECGVVELAGKAVGVPFVGMVAASLAIATAVREIEGGGTIGVRRFDVKTLDAASAATDEDRSLDIPTVALKPFGVHR